MSGADTPAYQRLTVCLHACSVTCDTRNLAHPLLVFGSLPSPSFPSRSGLEGFPTSHPFPQHGGDWRSSQHSSPSALAYYGGSGDSGGCQTTLTLNIVHQSPPGPTALLIAKESPPVQSISLNLDGESPSQAPTKSCLHSRHSTAISPSRHAYTENIADFITYVGRSNDHLFFLFVVYRVSG